MSYSKSVMALTLRRLCTAAISFLAVACGSKTDPTLGSATAFTKSFYAWYVPKAEKGMGVQLALGDSAYLFDSSLVAALRADSEAQAQDSNEVVGLDGDPFLNAQDFCQSYEIGSARHDSTRVLVDVFGVCDGKRDTRPVVVAELVPRGASWIFMDFQYPEAHSSLERTLAELAKSRGKKK